MNTAPTLNLIEAAVMLGAEPETISKLARRGEIPATQIGKGWIFLRDDVLEFLKERIGKDTEERRRKSQIMSLATVQFSEPTRRSRRRNVPELPTLPLRAEKPNA